jgi:hypothetical protein
MKLSYPEKAAAAERSVAKISKPKSQLTKTAEKPVVEENKFELFFAPETPVAPLPPTAPPTPEFANEGFNFSMQFPEAEELLKTAAAPDPRDKRNPDILRSGQYRKAQELVRTTEAYRTIRDNTQQIQDLAKLKGNMVKIAHPEQIYTEKVLEDMVQNMIQGEAITPEFKVEKKKVSGTRVARPMFKTAPADNGMTITIIRNEEQIEITVKDKR